MISIDGTCDNLVIQQFDGAIELLQDGHPVRLADGGERLLGGQPVAPACFDALVD